MLLCTWYSLALTMRSVLVAVKYRSGPPAKTPVHGLQSSVGDINLLRGTFHCFFILVHKLSVNFTHEVLRMI